MNYAEKELREAMAYLDAARAKEEALRLIGRAFDMKQPVEVTLRCAGATITMLCPEKEGGELCNELSSIAGAQRIQLERQEVYWCEEVAAVDKQAKLNMQLRQDRNKTYQQVVEEGQQTEDYIRQRYETQFGPGSSELTQEQLRDNSATQADNSL